MESRSRLSHLLIAGKRCGWWIATAATPGEILKDVSYFDWYDNRHILFASQAENGRAQSQTVELTSRAVTLLVQTSDHRIGRVEGWLKPSLHRGPATISG